LIGYSQAVRRLGRQQWPFKGTSRAVNSIICVGMKCCAVRKALKGHDFSRAEKKQNEGWALAPEGPGSSDLPSQKHLLRFDRISAARYTQSCTMRE
jgi:hypothetical protein